MKKIEKAINIECISCGSSNIETRKVNQSFPYRKNGNEVIELNAEIPVRSCSDCSFQFVDFEADDAKHNAVCRYLDVMTPAEVQSIRHDYGFTRKEFADITRIGEASLSRWETGELIQNPANNEFLFLVSFRENLNRLAERRGQDSKSISAASAGVKEDVIELGSVDRFPNIDEEELPKIQRAAAGFRL